MKVIAWVFDSGLIGLLGGVTALLVAFGTIPRRPSNPEAMRRYLAKYGTLLKILGLVAAIGGLVRFVSFLGVI